VPDPGIAMAHLREGLAALQAGKKAAERVDDEQQQRRRKNSSSGGGGGATPPLGSSSSSSWAAAFEAEAKTFERASARLDRERLTVYMTTVPLSAPAAPAARVVVAASAATAPAATPGLF